MQETHENPTFDSSSTDIPESLETTNEDDMDMLKNHSTLAISDPVTFAISDPVNSKPEKKNLDPSSYVNIYNVHRHIPQFRPFLRCVEKVNFEMILGLTVLALYVVFFAAVLIIPSAKEQDDYWCDGDGFLIVNTWFFGSLLVYFQILKRMWKRGLNDKAGPYLKKLHQFNSMRKVKVLKYSLVLGVFIIFLLTDIWDNPLKLTSAFGILVFIGIGALFSLYPTEIKFEQIVWGIGLQVTFGLIIMRWSVGRRIFACLGSKVSTFLSYSDIGSIFAIGSFLKETDSYAFKILPVVFYFGFFVSILYHFGILQWIIVKLGWILQVTMGTTPCESMATASNIFLGQSEAPLVIRPYIEKLTKSELHAITTGGFATVAGGVLAAYISFGIEASHLLSASFMSAPAALAMSKLFYPEVEESATLCEHIRIEHKKNTNLLYAVMNDLMNTIPLVANITAALIICMSFAAFSNSIVDWGCQLLNFEEGSCSIQLFLGYALYPVAWLMGVPSEDCYFIGYLLGTKIFITEFLAYGELAEELRKGLISPRAAAIGTYALCGFSSWASIGCQIGAIGYLAPSRMKDISSIIVRSFIAGNFACYLTACVAGMFLQDTERRLIANATLLH